MEIRTLLISYIYIGTFTFVEEFFQQMYQCTSIIFNEIKLQNLKMSESSDGSLSINPKLRICGICSLFRG